jgi:hypothetical protein
MRRSGIAAVVVAMALAAPAAQAGIPIIPPEFFGRANIPRQFFPRINPSLLNLNRFETARSLRFASPAFNPLLAGSLFSGGFGSSLDGSGYGNPYGYSYDPYGGAFMGYADIINAQGKFMVNREESFGTREKTKQAKIETRRRIIDEWMYERANTPTLEDLREQDLRMARRRALNEPPFTEILAGSSLNTLLDQLKMAQGGGARGTNVAMDEDTLKRINVTSGAGGNVGLLKNDGFLQWPLPLRAEEFNDERDAIAKALPKLVQEASTNGRVDVGTLNATQKNLDKLTEKLGDKVGDLGTSQFIESRRYLSLLNQALQVLSNDDVANYFNQKFSAKGKTVAELVKYMSDKGLRFAPATPGDEAAYRAMHQALASYVMSVSQIVAEKETRDKEPDMEK